MVFSSVIFLLFLLLCLTVQGLCHKTKTRNRVLLIFSLVFYLWGGIASLLLVVAISLFNWYAALHIADQVNRRRRKQFLGVAVAVNVAAFALMRFWSLFPWAEEGETIARYAIPMGFAFYMLQLIGYLVDVYRCEVTPQQSFSTLLLFAAFFPQSAGGPVLRYGDVQGALKARKLKASRTSQGIVRFSCGLAKKVILADACGRAVTELLGNDINTLAAAPVLALWLGSLFYMIQLFLELSAYADMAIGIGLMCGFRFPENFDFPYLASNLKDFWAGWNKTVLAFFRDYVYQPLGGKRHGDLVALLNLIITCLLFGLWTGGHANFMIWAFYSLIMYLIERGVTSRFPSIPTPVGHIWVLLTTLIGFVFFRYSDLGMLSTALKGLIGMNGAGFANGATGTLLLRHLLLLILALIACTPLMRILGALLRERSQTDRRWLQARRVVDIACPALLLLLSVLAMITSQLPTFIFFQL